MEQEKRLRVYNIDTPDKVQYGHAELFPNTVRSLVLWSSGCGKTKLIYFLLISENGFRFENIYIYSKTLEQPKYTLLKRIIDGIDGINIFTFLENDKVIAPEKVLPNSIFIMDDDIGEQLGLIREYFPGGSIIKQIYPIQLRDIQQYPNN